MDEERGAPEIEVERTLPVRFRAVGLHAGACAVRHASDVGAQQIVQRVVSTDGVERAAVDERDRGPVRGQNDDDRTFPCRGSRLRCHTSRPISAVGATSTTPFSTEYTQSASAASSSL